MLNICKKNYPLLGWEGFGTSGSAQGFLILTLSLGITSGGAQGTVWGLGIESGSAIYKASALQTYLLLIRPIVI